MFKHVLQDAILRRDSFSPEIENKIKWYLSYYIIGSVITFSKAKNVLPASYVKRYNIIGKKFLRYWLNNFIALLTIYYVISFITFK